MRPIDARRQKREFQQVVLIAGESQSLAVVEYVRVLSAVGISVIQLMYHDGVNHSRICRGVGVDAVRSFHGIVDVSCGIFTAFNETISAPQNGM